MLLLPRRRDVRVRRPVQQAPWLHFAHPLLPGSALTLRALDLSTSGCGLWRPATSPPLAPGLVLSAVEVELDDSSIFFADMRVQHATPAGGARAGTRVGCSWIDLSAPAQDTLQRWICGGRHRRRRAMLAL
jgi:c-di-GMP-binding flagellar brake protein YcgR